MIRTILLATTALLPGVGAVHAQALTPALFQGIEAPVDDAAKREVRASPKVTLGGTDDAIAFHTLLRSGDKLGSGTFGLIYDAKGDPIVGEDGAPLISNSADFSSLLQKDGQLYVVSHFETRPAAIYVTKVTQDAKTGTLTATNTAPVDFSADGGLWVPCAGSVTPWGTHLGSEEYEPDAHVIETTQDIDKLDDYVKPMGLYFNYNAAATEVEDQAFHPTMDGFRDVFKPYRYGYITEVTLDGAAPKGVKHYAMGRFSHELAYVLPDEKTVYLTDDGTNVGLYRFTADEAGNLDSGRLFAAKWVQTDAANGGSVTLDWIDLGAGTSKDVRALIDAGTKFSDIFDRKDMAEDGTCADGFSPSAANGVRECLKVRDGMDFAASRLETRRYAAIKGATTEIRKEEGLTYDPDHHKLYVAISEISNGMEDAASKGKASEKYDLASANDIKVDFNPCGGVYKLALDEANVATSMKALLVGKPRGLRGRLALRGEHLRHGRAREPRQRQLHARAQHAHCRRVDTETGHQNDAVWSMDLATKALTRIETTPYGAETTSVFVYLDVNGFSYIMSVVQHPYGESDEDKLAAPEDAQAYVGYIGPMPKLD